MEMNKIRSIYSDYIQSPEYATENDDTSKSGKFYDICDEYISQSHSREEADKLSNMLLEAASEERENGFVEGFRYAVRLMRDVYGA